MGQLEDQIRLDAEYALAGLEDVDVRRMFSGWGFYYRDLLFAAAWEGRFRFRHRRDGHWVYEAVEPALLQDEEELIAAARRVIRELESEPAARRGRPRRRLSAEQ
jgi:TfoX N-terminal domain